MHIRESYIDTTTRVQINRKTLMYIYIYTHGIPTAVFHSNSVSINHLYKIYSAQTHEHIGGRAFERTLQHTRYYIII